MSRVFRLLLILIATAALAGCQGLKTKGLFSRLRTPAPLRVGIALDRPPLAYAKGEVAIGLEVKFAAGLAQHLDRRLELVDLPRKDLAQALLDDKVDIVMAGMTVSDAQAQKLATTNPYLISGQVVLIHLDDFKQLGSGTRNLTAKSVRIGVVEGSSGDSLLKGLNPKGTISRYPQAQEGIQALIGDTIDVFLCDLPTNGYYASLYVDKGLTPGVTPLTREPLAWAVRPDDSTTRESANAYLAAIEQSGELQKMLENTLPFYRNTAYSPRQ
jgi:polar amino acid transport system substrate-binding protein